MCEFLYVCVLVQAVHSVTVRCVCVCDVICYALSQREVSECVGARAGICFALSHTKLCVSVCMCV